MQRILFIVRKKPQIKSCESVWLTDVTLAMAVLNCVIVAQLVFDGVEDKPALLPALEQCPALVEMSFVCSVLCDVGRELLVVLLVRCVHTCTEQLETRSIQS